VLRGCSHQPWWIISYPTVDTCLSERGGMFWCPCVQVNALLDRRMKGYIKLVACCPEKVRVGCVSLN
jgi:hypothetical protein